MRLERTLTLLVLVGGCARSSNPVGTPAPSVAATAAPDSNHVSPQPTIVPAPPLPEHSAVDDSALLARLAADSALDAAVLDKLHETTVTADPAASLETAAAELGTTFDINVASYADHARVRHYMDFFQGAARDRMAIWLNRLPRYEPMIRAALLANGLPGDLVYLGLIESGYSNTAVSRSKAVGMWQFMRGTGKEYGLRIDGWVDERRDPLRATHAAARYLARLTDQFGSHYLAAAAYNGGPGTIRRGLKRIVIGTGDDASADDEGAEESTADDSFFQLSGTRYLRRETKDYVPKLIAAAMIAKQPEKYGFEPAQPVDPFQVDSIEVTEAISLDAVAKVGDLSVADLLDLNAHFLHAVTPPGERTFVRVPPGRGDGLAELLRDLPADERLPAFTYVLKRRETFRSVATRFGLTSKQLGALNPKVTPAKAGPGTALVIPGAARLRLFAAEDRRLAGNRSGAAGRIHTVKRGETLSGVSRRYGVPVGQLRAWNGLTESAVIRIGQRLTIGPKRAPAAAKRTPTAKKSSSGARPRAG